MCFPPPFPTVEKLTDLDYCTASLAKLKGITLSCLNVRGILSKLDSIRLILGRSKVDCLILNETFLTPNIDDSELHIDKYNLHHFDRTKDSGKSHGGGLIIYTHTKYDFITIESSEVCSPAIENVWIKLRLPKARPTYISCFYRPPDGSIPDFIETLNVQLSTMEIEAGSDIVMMGDANIDVLKQSQDSRSLNALLNNHNLKQVISKATRITDTTNTLIDHVYVNNPDQYAHRGSLDPGLSDHKLTFICRKRAKISHEKKTIFIRNYRDFNCSAFCNDLANIDWSDVINAQSVDEAVSVFNFLFLEVINKHLPYKKIRARENSAPWVTAEFLSLIDAREYKSSKYNKCPCAQHLWEKEEAERLVQRVTRAPGRLNEYFF